MLSDRVLLNYSNKLFTGLSHSTVSFLKSEGEWFVNSLYLMAQWVVKKKRQTPYIGSCFIINSRVVLYICSYSTFASWCLETLSRYSSALQLNLISPFLSIRSMKIPLEVPMRDAPLVSSQNDSAAKYQLHLAPSTWI